MRCRYTTLAISVGARRYVVDCKVIPPRAPAHAGADSPRHLDPGSPGSVEVVRVRKGGFDVTSALDADLRVLLRDRCGRMAGVGRSTVPALERGVLEFER
ncbi:MAG: hypothetical protein NTV38_09785 [Chloroflexi bacterium]|nr:hypothetical protein [Chloroflexota bacterium]